ncbi:hypothetical protein J3R74_000925 [Puniceicoccus vermicola]
MNYKIEIDQIIGRSLINLQAIKSCIATLIVCENEDITDKKLANSTFTTLIEGPIDNLIPRIEESKPNLFDTEELKEIAKKEKDLIYHIYPSGKYHTARMQDTKDLNPMGEYFEEKRKQYIGAASKYLSTQKEFCLDNSFTYILANHKYNLDRINQNPITNNQLP